MAPSALLILSCTTPSKSINHHLPPLSSNFSNKPTAPALLKITNTLNCQNQRQSTANSWASLTSEINAQIVKHLPKTPPPAVTDPMHRLIAAAPPSVASALCLAACELVGGEKSHAMRAACAVQLMHAAAHAHMTLPCRSGVDLMTADGLFPLGYEIVTASSDSSDPQTAVRVVLEMARAMGPLGGVVEGQLMMTTSEGGSERHWAWERKGGRMAACGAACGAIVGGGREEEVERLRRFGVYVGLVNEMTSGGGENSYGEAVEVFRSLARLELQGFDKERVDDVVAFFQLGTMA